MTHSPLEPNSVQLLGKMFHVADLSLTKESLDVTRNQFTSEVLIKAPLTMDGRPFQIELQKNLLMFGRKPLQPFIVGENKDELLSKELPSIYPVSRSLSLRSQNIYRLETKFRELNCRSIQYSEINLISSLLQRSKKEPHLII